MGDVIKKRVFIFVYPYLKEGSCHELSSWNDLESILTQKYGFEAGSDNCPLFYSNGIPLDDKNFELIRDGDELWYQPEANEHVLTPANISIMISY